MSDQPPPDPYAPPPPDPYRTQPVPPVPPGYPPPGYGTPPPYGQPPGYGTPPGYPQPYGMPGGYAPVPPPTSNGLAVAALIVGIIALLTCWIPYLGIPLPVVALILGILALNRAKKINLGRGMAVTGVVLGVVALLIALVVAVLATIYLMRHSSIFDCADNNLTQSQQQQCIRDQLDLPSFAPST